MAKQWICLECGTPVIKGEKCYCCEYFEIPEEYLSPQQRVERDYEGVYENY